MQITFIWFVCVLLHFSIPTIHLSKEMLDVFHQLLRCKGKSMWEHLAALGPILTYQTRTLEEKLASFVSHVSLMADPYQKEVWGAGGGGHHWQGSPSVHGEPPIPRPCLLVGLLADHPLHLMGGAGGISRRQIWIKSSASWMTSCDKLNGRRRRKTYVSPSLTPTTMVWVVRVVSRCLATTNLCLISGFSIQVLISCGPTVFFLLRTQIAPRSDFHKNSFHPRSG